jgi:hypothetical protein
MIVSLSFPHFYPLPPFSLLLEFMTLANETNMAPHIKGGELRPGYSQFNFHDLLNK